MSGLLTIEEMVEQTPEGETRLFEAPTQGATEDRFFRVWFNNEYPNSIEWDLKNIPREQFPWLGLRGSPRRPLSVLPERKIFATSKAARLVDLYSWNGGNMFLISNRLLEIIEGLDPGSLDCRPVAIFAKDQAVDFNLVMPSRNLEVVDLERTDVLIKSELYGKTWVKKVRFPKTVIFQRAVPKATHNFSDVDQYGWFWSRESIDAAKAAGIKGLYTRRAGGGGIGDVDRM